MVTGASPISEEVFDFLRICFGAAVIEVGPRLRAGKSQSLQALRHVRRTGPVHPCLHPPWRCHTNLQATIFLSTI